MPLRIDENAPLAGLNSFAVPARAQRLLTLTHSDQLPSLAQARREYGAPVVLGGGNNVLIATSMLPCVLHVGLRGRQILQEQADASVVIEAAAGENWHALVEWTLAQGLGGLENLALIPGTVGAAPIQNIGAYGVELAEHFESLEAVHLESGHRRRFGPRDCAFGYRDSLFKHDDGKDWLILSVRLRLSRTPVLRTGYASLRAELDRSGDPISARSLADAVIRIRRSKLPDPTQIGNAGSFFKNPMVDRGTLSALQRSYPDLPVFDGAHDARFKIPAAWLIERAGWKGRRTGKVGVHSNHALVLVNHGGASGSEILALAEQVQEAVMTQFGIRLEPEPVILRARS